jgi:hypothetical protein
MTLQNKLLLLFLTTIAIGGIVYSQIFIHKKNRKDLLEIAREIAFTWKEKLGLTTEQTVLLENIIIEFTIRKNEILNENTSEKEKIERLQKVQIREHKNLRKFLNETEFDSYVGINKRIPNNIMDSLSMR